MEDIKQPTARSAHEHLCTYHPIVSAAHLSAIEDALASRPLDDPSLALCPALFAGAFFGTTIKSSAPVAPAAELSDDVVPGLVLSTAHPSQYATTYAHLLLRVCRLLSCDEPMLCRSLANYELPSTRADEAAVPGSLANYELPSTRADEPAVPEVAVMLSANETGGEEEVWAADLDDDADAYEPIESPAAAAAAAAASESGAPPPAALPTAAQARARLSHALNGLSHDPLAALPPGAWARLGLGTALRAALTSLREDDVEVDASASSSSSSPITAHLDAPARSAGMAAVTSLVRDHLLHEPMSTPAELPPILTVLSPPRRVLFLASLVAADSAPSTPVRGKPPPPPLPAAAWGAIDEAVREQLVPLLHEVDDNSVSRADVAQGQLNACLHLLQW